MIHHDELRRLNRRFGDALGYAPPEYGVQPRYKWAWAPDLRFPVRKGWQEGKSPQGLLYTYNPVFEDEPQIEDEERWMVAFWREPPSPREWRQLYGDELRYPTLGIYYATSLWLKPDAEPNERVTDLFIEHIRQHKSMSIHEALGHIRETGERRERETEQRDFDILANRLPEYGRHIPGVRGGDTSFGGWEPEKETGGNL